MPAELDQTTPEMDQNPEMDAPDMGAEPMGLDGSEADREGAMAKQELIKLAHYAQSLQEHIQDDEQLESWCQAKITMAAQNIASVYHYMAYEKKIGEYSDALENNPSLNENQRTYLRNRLAEAKMKIKELKKAQAVLKEDFDLKKSGDTANTHKGGTVTKTDKGLTHTKGDYDDEPFAEPSKKPSKAAKSSNEKSGDRAHDKAQNKEYKVLKAQGKAQRYSAGQPIDEEKTEPCDHCGGAGHVPKAPVQIHPAHAKKVDDYSKFRKAVIAIAGDKNGDGVVDEKDKAMAESKSKCCCEEKGKMKCPVHKPMNEAGRTKCCCEEKGKMKCPVHKPMNEAERTMSRAAKGVMKYGKDGMKALAKAGKDGKDLDKVRDKYDKYDESAATPFDKSQYDGDREEPAGSKSKPHPKGHLNKMLRKKLGEPGKKVDESKPSAGLSAAKKSAVVKTAKAGGDIGKPGKSFDKVAKAAGGGEKGEKIAAAAMWKNMKETVAYMAEKKAIEKKDKPMKGDKIADEGNEFSGELVKARAQHKDSFKVDGKTFPVKESSEVDRLRELTGRLNQNERASLNESGEVASIRALTQRLLG